MPMQDAELCVVDEISSVVARTSIDEITALIDAMQAANRMFVGGAGRSLLMVKTFAMRLMHLGISAHVVGETITPAIKPGDLLIVASGSGQTRTTLAITEAAKSRGALTAAITAHPEAPIPLVADLVVHIHSPITTKDPLRPSRQPPGSLFEQCLLVHCEAMVLRLMDRLGTSEDDMRKRHTKLE